MIPVQLFITDVNTCDISSQPSLIACLVTGMNTFISKLRLLVIESSLNVVTHHWNDYMSNYSLRNEYDVGSFIAEVNICQVIQH